MQGKSALPHNTGSPCSHEQTYEAFRSFGNFAFGQLFIDCMNQMNNEDSCTFCRISWKECILWIKVIFGRPSDLARRDLTHFGGRREHRKPGWNRMWHLWAENVVPQKHVLGKRLAGSHTVIAKDQVHSTAMLSMLSML